jgi:hypothetical protein
MPKGYSAHNQRTHAELVELFMTKVSVNTNGCWEWTAFIDKHGYGMCGFAGKMRRAHVVAYMLFVGPFPAGMVTNHLCYNRKCVNPEHIEAVTVMENNQKKQTQANRNTYKLFCKRGHLFDDDNTIIDKKTNARKCRACHNARRRVGT